MSLYVLITEMLLFKYVNKFVGLLFIGLITFYKGAISPLLPASCRHYPTCSTYTVQAIRRFGAFRGGWLGLNRILRCHPFGTSGFDPVPVILVKPLRGPRGANSSRLKAHSHPVQKSDTEKP